MNRIIAAVGITALTTAFSQAAFAADLPPRVASIPYKAPALTPAFTWTGFYLGAQVGGGRGTDKVTNLSSGAAFPAGFVHVPNHPAGVLGGLYAGYNYQIGSWILGVDGDYSWASLKGTSTDVAPTGSIGVLREKVDWLATVTGRAGYAMNNWLFFVKGGGAWAGFKGVTNGVTAAGVPAALVTSSDTRSGWTVGIGAEWAITSNWLLKAEYDYVDFGTSNYNVTNMALPAGTVTVLNRNATTTLNIGKVGAAYKF